MFDEEKLRKQLDELNSVFGTPQVYEYERKVELPIGWHLDVMVFSKKFCVVDHMGMIVFE